MSNLGIFARNQFLRIFLVSTECLDYLQSYKLHEFVHNVFYFGKSFLNYKTITGLYGDNDINDVYNSIKFLQQGPVNLNNTLEFISYMLAVDSIEISIKYNPEFKKTEYFHKLQNYFGIGMGEVKDEEIRSISKNLLDAWSKKDMYSFLEGYFITNIIIKLELENKSKPNIPSKICKNAPKETGVIYFSIRSYISSKI